MGLRVEAEADCGIAEAGACLGCAAAEGGWDCAEAGALREGAAAEVVVPGGDCTEFPCFLVLRE